MNKVQVEVMGTRVLVIREKVEEVTAGGLIIPKEAQKKVEEAVIVAVGEKCELYNVGDRIIIPWGEGTPITMNGQDVLVLEEDTIQVRIARG